MIPKSGLVMSFHIKAAIAGAIISGGKGTATEKVAALEDAGIIVAPTPAQMGDAVVQAIERSKK